LDWVDFTFRRSRSCRGTESFFHTRPEHPFCAPEEPAWSRFPIPSRPAIPPPHDTTMWRRRAGTDASHQSSAADLLSRAARRTLPFQARGLTPLRPSRLSRASCWVGNPTYRSVPARTTLGHHCWCFQPWMAGEFGAAPTNRSRIATPEGDAQCPRQEPAPSVVGLAQAGRSGSHAPPVAAQSCCRHPGLNPRGQNRPLPVLYQWHGAVDPRRLPPTSPTAHTQALAQALAAWAATGTLAWPPKTQLPTCVHAPHPRSARPTTQTAIRRRPVGHMPPVSFYNGVSPDHAIALPDPRCRPRRTTLPPGDSAPCGAPPTGRSQARGHLASSTASTPTSATARRGGFTPT
jgi:hypothetical protein